MTGDIRITPYVSGGQDPVPMPRHLPSEDKILAIPGVTGIVPVVSRAGIVKNGEIVHGVIVKGTPDQVGGDGLAVSIPHRLAEITGLQAGEDLTTYFVGEKVRARKFHITAEHRDIIETDDNLLVYARLEDMQRLNGWDSTSVSQLEVKVKNASPKVLKDIEARIGYILSTSEDEDENGLYVISSARSYPQIFDWLGLLDVNVLIVLILMTLVAGFNMISGLLVMLLRNIPLIGTLKALGMQDRAIGQLFVRIGAEAVLKGMLVGNALAFLFCLIQGTTHVAPRPFHLQDRSCRNRQGRLILAIIIGIGVQHLLNVGNRVVALWKLRSGHNIPSAGILPGVLCLLNEAPHLPFPEVIRRKGKLKGLGGVCRHAGIHCFKAL